MAFGLGVVLFVISGAALLWASRRGFGFKPSDSAEALASDLAAFGVTFFAGCGALAGAGLMLV